MREGMVFPGIVQKSASLTPMETFMNPDAGDIQLVVLSYHT